MCDGAEGEHSVFHPQCIAKTATSPGLILQTDPVKAIAVESREMLDGVATYYSLSVPYDDGLKTILDNDLKSIRLKSVDLNHEGEGNFVAVVVAGIVFEDNVATKIRLYKTSRWNE